jgi:hypothetical protein
MIWVFNHYNVSDSASLDDVVTYELEVAQGVVHKKAAWQVGSIRRVRVAGLDAARAAATYTRDNLEWREDFVVIYRPGKDAVNGHDAIIYTLQLSAPKEAYSGALRKFDETIAGFRILDLPHGPCLK